VSQTSASGSKKSLCSRNNKGSGNEPEPFSLASTHAYLATVCPRFGKTTGSVCWAATVLPDTGLTDPTAPLLRPPPPGDSTTGFGFGRIGGKVVDGSRLGGPTGCTTSIGCSVPFGLCGSGFPVTPPT